MEIDIEKLKKELIDSYVPMPITGHAIGYNLGIEHVFKIIERIEDEA